MKSGPEPLRRRLFLLAAATILPLALMAGAGLFILSHDQRRQAERAALEIARALSTAVDGELSRSAAVLEAIGTATLLNEGGLQRYHQLAQRVAATQATWQSIVVHDASGTMLLSTNYAFGAPLPATAEPDSVFAAALTGRPVIGHLARGPRNEWAFPVRVPVLRQGKPRYVLSAVVRPDHILELVRRQQLPDDWLISVFDHRKQRVARSRQHTEALGGGPAPSLQALMARLGTEGAGLTQALEGEDIYTAFSTSGQTGWTVAIGIPPSFVEAGASRSLFAFGGGVLLSLVLGALAALVLARSIARPIAELRAAAQALGRREPLVPPSTRIQEIRQVADSLIAASDERARGEAEREQLLMREQEARALAERANRAKDEFLAMLGHELRNPLAAIASASEVLTHSKAGPEASERAKAVVARQVAHLARMTDDLLDAARAMTGKIVLQRHPLDLPQVAAQLLPAFTARHRIVTRFESVWIDADATRIEQILNNLLGNAVKYTPPGGTIRVAVVREGGEAVLTIADDGPGMPPSLVARVFDPFVQGERSLDRAYGGLGIGLTLVRRLAELHGGSATAQSEGPGRGSVFTVRLPAIEPPPPGKAGIPTNRKRQRLRVLLVEDNDDARATLQLLLELDGHAVTVARDGPEALEAFDASLPDLALVDLGLPRLDGYEVARRIRARAAAVRPRLVALTGYGMPEDRELALASGFDEHLVKPVTAAALEALFATITPPPAPPFP